MKSRKIYPWLTSGAAMAGKRKSMQKIMKKHSLFFNGGDIEIVKLSREHNDANVLSIGARFVKDDEVKKAVEVWLSTAFSGDERHARRNFQIDNIE